MADDRFSWNFVALAWLKNQINGAAGQTKFDDILSIHPSMYLLAKCQQLYLYNYKSVTDRQMDGRTDTGQRLVPCHA